MTVRTIGGIRTLLGVAGRSKITACPSVACPTSLRPGAAGPAGGRGGIQEGRKADGKIGDLGLLGLGMRGGMIDLEVDEEGMMIEDRKDDGDDPRDGAMI